MRFVRSLIKAIKHLLGIRPLEIDPVILDTEGPEWDTEAWAIALDRWNHPERGD